MGNSDSSLRSNSEKPSRFSRRISSRNCDNEAIELALFALDEEAEQNNYVGGDVGHLDNRTNNANLNNGAKPGLEGIEAYTERSEEEATNGAKGLKGIEAYTEQIKKEATYGAKPEGIEATAERHQKIDAAVTRDEKLKRRVLAAVNRKICVDHEDSDSDTTSAHGYTPRHRNNEYYEDSQINWDRKPSSRENGEYSEINKKATQDEWSLGHRRNDTKLPVSSPIPIPLPRQSQGSNFQLQNKASGTTRRQRSFSYDGYEDDDVCNDEDEVANDAEEYSEMYYRKSAHNLGHQKQEAKSNFHLEERQAVDTEAGDRNKQDEAHERTTTMGDHANKPSKRRNHNHELLNPKDSHVVAGAGNESVREEVTNKESGNEYEPKVKKKSKRRRGRVLSAEEEVKVSQSNNKVSRKKKPESGRYSQVENTENTEQDTERERKTKKKSKVSKLVHGVLKSARGVFKSEKKAGEIEKSQETERANKQSQSSRSVKGEMNSSVQTRKAEAFEIPLSTRGKRSRKKAKIKAEDQVMAYNSEDEILKRKEKTNVKKPEAFEISFKQESARNPKDDVANAGQFPDAKPRNNTIANRKPEDCCVDISEGPKGFAGAVDRQNTRDEKETRSKTTSNNWDIPANGVDHNTEEPSDTSDGENPRLLLRKKAQKYGSLKHMQEVNQVNAKMKNRLKNIRSNFNAEPPTNSGETQKVLTEDLANSEINSSYQDTTDGCGRILNHKKFGSLAHIKQVKEENAIQKARMANIVSQVDSWKTSDPDTGKMGGGRILDPKKYGSLAHMEQIKQENAEKKERLANVVSNVDSWKDPNPGSRYTGGRDDCGRILDPKQYGSLAHMTQIKRENAEKKTRLANIASNVDSWNTSNQGSRNLDDCGKILDPKKYGSLAHMRQIKHENASRHGRLAHVVSHVDTWNKPNPGSVYSLQRKDEWKPVTDHRKYGSVAHYHQAKEINVEKIHQIKKARTRLSTWQTKSQMDALHKTKKLPDINANRDHVKQLKATVKTARSKIDSGIHNTPLSAGRNDHSLTNWSRYGQEDIKKAITKRLQYQPNNNSVCEVRNQQRFGIGSLATVNNNEDMKRRGHNQTEDGPLKNANHIERKHSAVDTRICSEQNQYQHKYNTDTSHNLQSLPNKHVDYSNNYNRRVSVKQDRPSKEDPLDEISHKKPAREARLNRMKSTNNTHDQWNPEHQSRTSREPKFSVDQIMCSTPEFEIDEMLCATPDFLKDEVRTKDRWQRRSEMYKKKRKARESLKKKVRWTDAENSEWETSDTPDSLKDEVLWSRIHDIRNNETRRTPDFLKCDTPCYDSQQSRQKMRKSPAFLEDKKVRRELRKPRPGKTKLKPGSLKPMHQESVVTSKITDSSTDIRDRDTPRHADETELHTSKSQIDHSLHESWAQVQYDWIRDHRRGNKKDNYREATRATQENTDPIRRSRLPVPVNRPPGLGAGGCRATQ